MVIQMEQEKKTAPLRLTAAALLAGLAAGGVAALYRLALEGAASLMDRAAAFARANAAGAVLWFAALAAMAAVVAFLLKKQPLTGGSGIPQVEKELRGEVHSNWLPVLAAKFAGGFLSLLGGLSLGREGPSIQLGAMAGKGVSRLLRREGEESRLLLSCGAGAGLAAAFHAPAAGVLFCLEELFGSFSPKLLLPLLAAVFSADLVSSCVFGVQPVFQFAPSAELTPALYALVLPLGILLGVLGAFYNAATVRGVSLLQKKSGLPVFVRVLLPFLPAGVLALVCPVLLGSGHEIVESAAAGAWAAWALALLLLGKFLFSLLSFTSGAPGGIFFPLLVLGALIGCLYGLGAVHLFGLDPGLVPVFLLLGMAGNFAAIVRAPFTGAVLLFEMTGSMPCLLPLLAVSWAACLTANALRSTPIYDSL